MSAGEESPTWSSIATWYDELVTNGSGPHELATATTLALAPRVELQVILDMACGQGRAARALAEAGAGDVIGLDSSPEMIDLARRHEHGQPLGISYRVDDAQSLETVDDGSVDGVTCQLALMDIPDLDARLAAVHRVLRPGGWFVFVIGHPCFLAPHALTMQDGDGKWGCFISEYFGDRFWRSANPCGVRRVGNYHRTLSTYLNALAASGLVLEVTSEPAADTLLSEQQPVYSVVPIFLAARARRPLTG